jgi:hypothetical protein
VVIAPLFLTSELDGGKWSTVALATLPLIKNPGALAQEAEWVHSRSGRCGREKNLLHLLGYKC